VAPIYPKRILILYWLRLIHSCSSLLLSNCFGSVSALGLGSVRSCPIYINPGIEVES
jgi:hypothetical protein